MQWDFLLYGLVVHVHCYVQLLGKIIVFIFVAINISRVKESVSIFIQCFLDVSCCVVPAGGIQFF